jgi:hypothetical protein
MSAVIESLHASESSHAEENTTASAHELARELEEMLQDVSKSIESMDEELVNKSRSTML